MNIKNKEGVTPFLIYSFLNIYNNTTNNRIMIPSGNKAIKIWESYILLFLSLFSIELDNSIIL